MQPTSQPSSAGNDSPAHISPMKWLRRASDETIKSPGEYLLPFFLALIEACWLNGILLGLAGVNFLNSGTALLSIWGPFVLLLLTTWVFRRGHSEEEQGGSDQWISLPFFFGLIALLTLVLCWLHIYSTTYNFFDPRWLLALFNDLLTLDLTAYEVLFMVALTLYLCRRGMQIARMTIEPAHIFRQLWVGLLILTIAVFLRAGATTSAQNKENLVLLLMIPLFLYLTLSAHALARIIFVRREHPVGLDGSTREQERALFSIITFIGCILLVLTVICGVLFSSSFFHSVQPLWAAIGIAYNWLVLAFSQIVVIIVTPLFWLITWLLPHGSSNTSNLTAPKGPIQNSVRHVSSLSPAPALVLAIKILLPVLVLALLCLMIYLILRGRTRLRIVLKRKSNDTHESIWSWQLFWQQFSLFWRTLFGRLLPTPPTQEAQSQLVSEANLAPQARTIREVYRALLQRAAILGHVRKRDETPYEFRQRLDETMPASEPQLSTITEAYTLVRYGGTIPDEGELQGIQQRWRELDEKWHTT